MFKNLSEKIRFYVCAIIIAADGLILILLLSTIFLGRLVAHPLSWTEIAILVGFLSILHLGLLAVTLFRIAILREEWALTLFGSFGAAYIFWDEIKLLKYLQKKKYKQNIPSETSVIVAFPDYSFLEGWIRAHWSYEEMVALCELIDLKENDVSFYLRASIDDVRGLMVNTSVKRMYFVGHGSRNSFGLSNGLVILYDEFAGDQFVKEYVHQVHCGHGEGESLVDRVVPPENRNGCFFFPEMISNKKIISELKKMSRSQIDAKKKAAH